MSLVSDIEQNSIFHVKCDGKNYIVLFSISPVHSTSLPSQSSSNITVSLTVNQLHLVCGLISFRFISWVDCQLSQVINTLS